MEQAVRFVRFRVLPLAGGGLDQLQVFWEAAEFVEADEKRLRLELKLDPPSRCPLGAS